MHVIVYLVYFLVNMLCVFVQILMNGCTSFFLTVSFGGQDTINFMSALPRKT